MDATHAVRVVEGRGHLRDDLGGAGDGNFLVFFEQATQRTTLDPLHGDIGSTGARVGVGVVDADDARMSELTGGPRFQEKSLLQLPLGVGVEGQVGEHDLERHLAIEVGIVRQVDPAHGARSELADDLVAGDGFYRVHDQHPFYRWSALHGCRERTPLIRLNPAGWLGCDRRHNGLDPL
jgi:hypothetical protein